MDQRHYWKHMWQKQMNFRQYERRENLMSNRVHYIKDFVDKTIEWKPQKEILQHEQFSLIKLFFSTTPCWPLMGFRCYMNFCRAWNFTVGKIFCKISFNSLTCMCSWVNMHVILVEWTFREEQTCFWGVRILKRILFVWKNFSIASWYLWVPCKKSLPMLRC